MNTYDIYNNTCPFCFCYLREEQSLTAGYHNRFCRSCRWHIDEKLSKYTVFYHNGEITAAHFFVNDLYVQIEFERERIRVSDYGTPKMMELYVLPLDQFDNFRNLEAHILKTGIPKSSKENTMQKLYRGQLNTDVLFLSNSTNEDELIKQGKQYLNKQGEIPKSFTITEIMDLQDVPLDWKEKGTWLWGTNEEITAEDFLQRENDPDYRLYLQLKERFE